MRWFSLGVALVVIGAGSNPVLAQDGSRQCSFPDAERAGCVCTLKVFEDESVPVANLTDIVGDVSVTRKTGYTPLPQPIAETVALFAGDSIVVPSDGQAYLNFGPDCRRLLPANSSLVIRQEGECACAAVFGLGRGAAAIAVTGAAAIATGVAVLASENKNKKKVSGE